MKFAMQTFHRFTPCLVVAALLATGAAIAAGKPSPGGEERIAAPLLWQVQGTKAVHYLIGSVHMLPASAYPLPAPLESAYAATRGLVLEADLAGLNAPELQGRMLGAAKDDSSGGLKSRIGDTLYRKLQQRAAAMGVPGPLCDDFRAWFCALTLELIGMQRAGFGAEYGVDQHFFDRAREDGRAVTGLESPEQQLALFIEMPETMSTNLLAATLDETTSESQNPEELLRIWREGDLPALEKMLKDLRRQYPGVYARLLADRNRAWIPKLTALFGSDAPQLVIVGAAHFAGPDGLLALLKEKGVSVRPVTGPIAPGEVPAKKE